MPNSLLLGEKLDFLDLMTLGPTRQGYSSLCISTSSQPKKKEDTYSFIHECPPSHVENKAIKI